MSDSHGDYGRPMSVSKQDFGRQRSRIVDCAGALRDFLLTHNIRGRFRLVIVAEETHTAGEVRAALKSDLGHYGLLPGMDACPVGADAVIDGIAISVRTPKPAVEI